jgi:gluconolactonase
MGNDITMDASGGQTRADSKPVLIAATVCWLEGPACDEHQNTYFTDVRGNRVLKLAANGVLSVLRGPGQANYPNGQAIDIEGRLITCEEGDPDAGTPPRLTRTDLKSNAVEVLVDNFEGKRLSGPSDVAVDGAGNVYFTDGGRPFFLPPLPTEHPEFPNGFMASTSVFRLSASGKLTRILGDGSVAWPNGINLSPDSRTLYVVENDISESGIRQLRAYDLDTDGNASKMRVVFDFYPGRSADGLTVDRYGNLYVAAGLNILRGTAETLDTKAGIHVFSPNGERLRIIPVREDSVTNVTFGGEDLRTLYITAGKTVFTVENDIAGLRR